MNRLYVLGAGSGGPAQVTPAVNEVLKRARAVAASERCAPLAEGCPEIIPMTDFKECFARLHAALESGDAAVLVSGDTGIYSLLPLVNKNFPEAEIIALPGISSMQSLCAMARETWHDAVILSGHGRDIDDEKILEAVEHDRKTFFFCDGRRNPAWLASLLSEAGLGDVLLTVGENLGGAGERLTQGTAAELAGRGFSALSIVLVINESSSVKRSPLPCDDDFTRGSVPMTHEEVRAVIISKLRLTPESVVWDIGAGTGSVSIAAAQLCRRLFAVEASAEAAALVRANAEKFRLHNVKVVEGRAMSVIEELPKPDVVFIGGSGGELAAVLEEVRRRGGGIRVVVSAVALHTAAACVELLDAAEFRDFEAAQVAVSRIKTIGRTKIWSPLNPVSIFSAVTAGKEE